MKWLGESLRTAVEYRTIWTILGADDRAKADQRAAEVYGVIASQKSSDLGRHASAALVIAPTKALALNEALRTLDRIEEIAARRESAKTSGAAATRRAFARASVRSVLT